MLLNLAGYLFADIADPPALCDRLRTAAPESVRGTILVAPEGINAFLCGPPDAVQALLAVLRAEPGLAGFRGHESHTEEQSFRRFLVRLKKEIITFRQPGLRPLRGRAATVAPATLARWLDQGHDDEGRPVRMVDTRNAFEVAVGTFAGALDPGLRSFTDLPAALEPHRAALAGQRLVTFCTGGIRCEKAALWMDEAGFEHVVQLEGGVLGWFEQQGGAHWQGELFVFDRRVSITPALQPGQWTCDYPERTLSPPAANPSADLPCATATATATTTAGTRP